MASVSPALFDRGPIERLADELTRTLSDRQAAAAGRRIVVSGPPGAGRHMLVSALAARLGAAAVPVLVPSLDDDDAPVHSLLQVAASLERDAVATVEDGAQPLADRVEATLRRLSRGAVLLVHVPARRRRRLDDEEPSRHWLHDLVRTAARLGVATVLVVPPEEARGKCTHRLPVTWASLEALEEVSLWGGYAEQARTLRRTIGHKGLAVTPLQLRLMVGLVGLGAPPADIVKQQLRGGDLVPLARSLVGLLASEALADVRGAVRRVALVRRPLPVADALALARVPHAHEALLAHCIGYGDAALRVPDHVRSVLLQKVPRGPDEAAHHKAVADHHARLDGATSAVEALGGDAPMCRVTHWLEKVHHLAHAGPSGFDEWKRQKLTSREFLIDRARSLSIDAHDYEGAAELYQRCLALDPHDAYALHYRAYNLDRAGVEAVEVERCYRNARDRQRTNLFYNSRLVTFFIEQGRPLDGEEAWQAAQENLETRPKDQVVHHVTLHVARAWLSAGDVHRARRVFDTVPYACDEDRSVMDTEQRLLDAEEALGLGASVYPPDLPMLRRWKGPLVVPLARNGQALRHWFPARVVADGDEVVLVVAVPHSEAGQRRVFSRRLSPDEWRRMAEWWQPGHHGYVELGEYDDGVYAFAALGPDTRLDRKSDEEGRDDQKPHPLRYLARAVTGSPLGAATRG